MKPFDEWLRDMLNDSYFEEIDVNEKVNEAKLSDIVRWVSMYLEELDKGPEA
jgi:hypothetical protein